MAFVRVTDPEQIIELYMAKVLYHRYSHRDLDDIRPCRHAYTKQQIRTEVYADKIFNFYVHLED